MRFPCCLCLSLSNSWHSLHSQTFFWFMSHYFLISYSIIIIADVRICEAEEICCCLHCIYINCFWSKQLFAWLLFANSFKTLIKLWVGSCIHLFIDLKDVNARIFEINILFNSYHKLIKFLKIKSCLVCQRQRSAVIIS